MTGYSADQLEDALCKLWELVEDRLTDEDYLKLGIDRKSMYINGALYELYFHGPSGPVGIGLGRCGGHAIG